MRGFGQTNLLARCRLLGTLPLALLALATAVTGLADAHPDSRHKTRVDGRGGAQLVRLTARPVRVKAGKNVRVRIENNSSLRIEFGEEFSVQRKLSGGWIRAPFSPHGPWFEGQLGLPPGRAGTLSTFAVPSNAASGLYRAVKPIVINGSAKFRTANFRVVH